MRLYMLQSFILGILVSYLQRRIKCVFKNCGYPESWRGAKPPPQRRARDPPSPQCGAGWGAINHVTDIGFHSVIWYLSDQKGHCERARGATLRSHPQEPPSGATLRSHPQEPPTLRTHPPSGATLEWHLINFI